MKKLLLGLLVLSFLTAVAQYTSNNLTPIPDKPASQFVIQNKTKDILQITYKKCPNWYIPDFANICSIQILHLPAKTSNLTILSYLTDL